MTSCARGSGRCDDAHLRRLRRPLRPGDADPGARRARRGVARGAGGRGLRAGAARALHLLRRPADAAHARAPVRARAARLPEARGPPPHGRAQAEQRGRPGAARAAAPGAPGVATATVCARFGFDCVVYMGSEDMRRQRPNVERMRLLGAEVRPVGFGTKTLKEATSEAIRDWIGSVETTHYLIGSCVGPAPYPELVAELQSVIGREAREQHLAAEGRPPEAVVACVGGGSNAIGMFAGFVDDADV